MNSKRKKHYLAILILFQLVVAVTGGMMVLSAANSGEASPHTYVDKIDIGRLDKNKVIQSVKKYFDGIINDGAVNIIYEGGEYRIGFKDIDLTIDYDKTINAVRGEQAGDSFINLINGYFIFKDRKISPIVTFNEEKLRSRLDEFAKTVKRDPVNANIFLNDGKITKSPEENGRKLNIDNAVDRIKNNLDTNLQAPIILGSGDQRVMEVIPPEITLKDLDGISDVIANYSTVIKDFESEDSMKLAAYAINKVLVCPADPVADKKAGVFSFNKYLGAEKGILNQDVGGYNQVVSTLYAALLAAGFKADYIERTPNNDKVEYIDPQYSTKVMGASIDFKFTNNSGSAVIVFAEVKDNKVTVSIVGKKK